jgi:hypothetical protein
MIQRLHELSSRRPALISGILGALVAVLFFPTWQHAVESGQILAVVVAYPDHDNPFYVYHRYAPSLLNHLASWLISATDEIVTCLTFSALQGGLSYLALGVILQVFIKTGRHLIPLVILFAHLSGIMELPMPYPMEIAGSVGYGSFAQALFLLSGALYVTGRYRWMLFNLLFVTPLIHPTVGLLAVATVFLTHCVSTWFSRRRILPRFADDSRGYLFAALLFLAAFVALTLLHYPSRPYTSFDSTTINITRQFLDYWSNHHDDFPFVSLVGITFSAFTLAICLLALLDRETKSLGESRAWFFLVAAASIALMGAILSWMPISWTWIPISFWQTMPLRWPNLVMSPIPAIALVILIAHGKTRIVGILLLIAGIAGVESLGLNSDVRGFLGINEWDYNGITEVHHFVAIVIVIGAVFFEFTASKTCSLSDRIFGRFRGRKKGLGLPAWTGS